MDDEEQRSLNRRKSVEAVNHSRKRKRDRESVGEEEHPGENAKSRRIRIALDNCGVIAERSHGAHSLVRITQSTSVQYPVGAVVLSINSEPTTSMNNEKVLTLIYRTSFSIPVLRSRQELSRVQPFPLNRIKTNQTQSNPRDTER